LLKFDKIKNTNLLKKYKVSERTEDDKNKEKKENKK